MAVPLPLPGSYRAVSLETRCSQAQRRRMLQPVPLATAKAEQLEKPDPWTIDVAPPPPTILNADSCVIDGVPHAAIAPPPLRPSMTPPACVPSHWLEEAMRTGSRRPRSLHSLLACRRPSCLVLWPSCRMLRRLLLARRRSLSRPFGLLARCRSVSRLGSLLARLRLDRADWPVSRLLACRRRRRLIACRRRRSFRRLQNFTFRLRPRRGRSLSRRSRGRPLGRAAPLPRRSRGRL